MALLSFSMGLYSTLSLPPSTQHLYSILYHLYIFLFLYKPDYVYFIWQLTSSIKIHLLFFTSFENAVEQQQKKSLSLENCYNSRADKASNYRQNY